MKNKQKFGSWWLSLSDSERKQVLKDLDIKL